MKQIFEVYAKYNARMNEQFYQIARELDDANLKDDKGIYFGSVLGTLNHIVVGDIAWLKRFAAHPKMFSSLEFVRTIEQPKALNSILHENLDDLSSLRKILDGCILGFIEEIDMEALASNLTYSNFKGVQSTKPLKLLLLHFFNHQTHHRGQLSSLYSQMGFDIGVTDLLMEIQDA